MILVDIGNTSIHLALTNGKKIKKVLQLPTKTTVKKDLVNLLRLVSCEKIFICSVVPDAVKLFAGLGKSVFLVGTDIAVPIKSLYNRRQIGMDRIVGAYAVLQLYPDSRIIIDFGTAITFDFISPSGIYQGGFILPGIGSALKVLSGCALLPRMEKLTYRKVLIPRNTRDSINKGIEEGFSLMINALVEKYCRSLRISQKNPIIITGGGAKIIISRLTFPYIYDNKLVLKGLMLLADKEKRSRF
jgi:type III pantothenate kinase